MTNIAERLSAQGGDVRWIVADVANETELRQAAELAKKRRHPVSVMLIKPAAIATPFVEHAKITWDVEAKLPAPLYAPELVAKAILSAAETPQRDIFVGVPRK